MIARQHAWAGLVALLALVLVPASYASSGVAIDEKGDPLAGVRACYIAGGTPVLCVETDDRGSWSLPESDLDLVRLTLDGRLPREIGGGDQPSPVILHFAAALLVRLEDPAGEPITAGEVDVLSPTGKRYGPFPIRSAVGTKINSLEPGPVVILARSKGYAETRAKESELPAGKETVAVVRLEPKTSP